MNKKLLHFLGTFFLAAILSLLASNHSQAQVISGDLVGTVLDKTGAAVPGATIEAVNVETHQVIRRYPRKRPGGSAGAGMEAQRWLPGALGETLAGHGLGRPMPVFRSRWSLPHAGQ